MNPRTSPENDALFAAAVALGADLLYGGKACFFGNATQVEIGGLRLDRITWRPVDNQFSMMFALPDYSGEFLFFDSNRQFIENHKICGPVVSSARECINFDWRVYLAPPSKESCSEISVPSAICHDMNAIRGVYFFDLSSPSSPNLVHPTPLNDRSAIAHAKLACVETLKKARAFAAAADPDAFPFAYEPAFRELVMWLRELP